MIIKFTVEEISLGWRVIAPIFMAKFECRWGACPKIQGFEEVLTKHSAAGKLHAYNVGIKF
jgi:hypothetical protein